MAIRVQQAIFTSARGPQLDGYQLTSRSEGISDNIAVELSQWGPPHDTLLKSDESATSINFHPLSDGRYCLSRTIHAGQEYSSRTGARVYTQMLIIPPEGGLTENSPGCGRPLVVTTTAAWVLSPLRRAVTVRENTRRLLAGSVLYCTGST